MESPKERTEFPVSGEETEEIIEAMLFAAGYPLEYAKIAEILCLPLGQVRETILRMKDNYQTGRRGIQLVTLENSAQLCTKEKYEDYIRAALGIRQRGRLSGACLEVLAIIAYNQPVTKAAIEQIRGVDCGYALAALSEKSLIEIKGRLDVPGKPNLYGTTADFLRVFGLEKLADLPPAPDPDANDGQITIEGI